MALAAMGSFLALGCGDDDNNVQLDAGQKDANVQQDVAVQEDAPVQHDATPVQDDAGPQVDAANTSGTVVVVQVTPQPAYVGVTDAGAPIPSPANGVMLANATASWDPLTPSGDNPITFLDKRSGGLGCYAKYYRFANGVTDAGTPIMNMNDAGLTLPAESTANAGNVTVTGYTGGMYINPTDITDAGTPNMFAMNSTITCTRNEIMEGDAGTGRYEYSCDLLPLPVTGFLVPGTDTPTITAAGGGNEIGAFTATDVDVAPFPEVTNPMQLWSVTNPAWVTDGGVDIAYKCGTLDGGAAAPCNSVVGIQIAWTDTPTAADNISGPGTPTNELGRIVCSKIGGNTHFTIPADIWAAAFPAGSHPHTVFTYMVHMSLTVKHGMSTLIGVGGGQIGVTHM